MGSILIIVFLERLEIKLSSSEKQFYNVSEVLVKKISAIGLFSSPKISVGQPTTLASYSGNTCVFEIMGSFGPSYL